MVTTVIELDGNYILVQQNGQLYEGVLKPVASKNKKSDEHVYGANGVCEYLGLDAKRHSARVSQWKDFPADYALRPDPLYKMGKSEAFRKTDIDAFAKANSQLITGLEDRTVRNYVK